MKGKLKMEIPAEILEGDIPGPILWFGVGNPLPGNGSNGSRNRPTGRRNYQHGMGIR